MPNVFAGLQGEEADLIGFARADLADPYDAEGGSAPAATDLNGLAGGGEEADAVKAGAVLAEIHGVGRLDEAVAFGVGAFDNDA